MSSFEVSEEVKDVRGLFMYLEEKELGRETPTRFKLRSREDRGPSNISVYKPRLGLSVS